MNLLFQMSIELGFKVTFENKKCFMKNYNLIYIQVYVIYIILSKPKPLWNKAFIGKKSSLIFSLTTIDNTYNVPCFQREMGCYSWFLVGTQLKSIVRLTACIKTQKWLLAPMQVELKCWANSRYGRKNNKILQWQKEQHSMFHAGKKGELQKMHVFKKCLLPIFVL